jgi:multidrug resistance protein, MATE family
MRLLLKEVRPTLALAVPITFGSASMVLMGAIDSLMLGQLGKVPLAACAFASSVFGFFYIAGLGLLSPVAVMVSRSHGADQNAECSQWLRNGLGLGLLSGLVECLLMTLLVLRLDWFGQPAEVNQAVVPFYLLFALSLVPVMIFQVLRQYAESMGLAWLSMAVLFGCVGVNILINWILIFGNLGAPALGLLGAGIGTFVARVLCVLVLLFFLERKLPAEARLGHSLYGLRWLRDVGGRHLRELLRQGIPSAGQLLFEVCAFTAASVMMGWLGTESLAAHQIVLSCASLSFMAPLGLGIASGMRMSRALGANERWRLRPIGLSTFGLSALCMGTFALLFIFAGRPIAGFYIADQQVIDIASHVFIVAGLFQLFDGAQVVGSYLQRGLSDVHVPTLITGLAYWVVAIPTSYLLGVRHHSPAGIWSGLALGLGLAAILLFLRFLRMSRKLSEAAA